MNEIKLIKNCFIKGFNLTNRSLNLVIFYLFISHIALFISFFLNKDTSIIILPISLVFTFIFNLAIPFFLIEKQQNNNIKLATFFSINFSVFKRAFFQTLLLFLLLFLILLFIVIFASIFLKFSPKDVLNVSNSSELVLAVFIITPFLIFKSIFFMLEKNGLFLSLMKSFILSFKHLPFLITILFLTVLNWLLLDKTPITEPWAQFVKSSVSFYFQFVASAATLYYYQEIAKKQKV